MAPTALVTGCSSGIGHATARAFLTEPGWRVYATARERDRDGLETLADRGADVVALDLTDPTAVDRVVGRVREEAGGVDCLVNNAGYGQFGPVEDVPTDLLERQFAVHCFGPHRLIRAVLPGMRERGAGRIVNVTSAADRLAVAGIGGYNASKWALAALSDALRQELADTNVEVVVVQPGIVATPFYSRAVAEVDAAAAAGPTTDRSDSRTARTRERSPYVDLYRVLRRVRAVEVGGPLINDPDRVGRTVLEAATNPAPETHYRVGPVPLLGSLYGTLVPGAIRDRLSRLGLRLAASGPVLDLLERRLHRSSGSKPVDSDGERLGDRRPR
ncbi:SDR family oxidoreductase [Halopiger djelfimassiliensis]|uniref:SDR family oxidoreductase n=1 Tax=Halopiger djelfimassiliensis TaxID=1293047 RepID=UPI000677BD22|nr:SDR family oxidoreductase [Halopiger djelfimassiliensis]